MLPETFFNFLHLDLQQLCIFSSAPRPRSCRSTCLRLARLLANSLVLKAGQPWTDDLDLRDQTSYSSTNIYKDEEYSLAQGSHGLTWVHMGSQGLILHRSPPRRFQLYNAWSPLRSEQLPGPLAKPPSHLDPSIQLPSPSRLCRL